MSWVRFSSPKTPKRVGRVEGSALGTCLWGDRGMGGWGLFFVFNEKGFPRVKDVKDVKDGGREGGAGVARAWWS